MGAELRPISGPRTRHVSGPDRGPSQWISRGLLLGRYWRDFRVAGDAQRRNRTSVRHRAAPTDPGKHGQLHVASDPRLRLYGVDAGKLGRAKRGNMRRSHIGFVFQFHRLLPEFSALENVMIPQMLNGLDRNEAAKRAEQLMTMVGLESRADHRPGLLSGGEQQRVAIARALSSSPSLLLADDPTGNLDPTTTGEVFHILIIHK